MTHIKNQSKQASTGNKEVTNFIREQLISSSDCYKDYFLPTTIGRQTTGTETERDDARDQSFKETENAIKQSGSQANIGVIGNENVTNCSTTIVRRTAGTERDDARDQSFKETENAIKQSGGQTTIGVIGNENETNCRKIQTSGDVINSTVLGCSLNGNNTIIACPKEIIDFVLELMKKGASL